MFSPEPPSIDTGSQYLQPYMCQLPPPTNLSSRFRPLMSNIDVAKSPDNILESLIESISDSLVPEFSTQVSLKNSTLKNLVSSSQTKKANFLFNHGSTFQRIQLWELIKKEDDFWRRLKESDNNYRERYIEKAVKTRYQKLNVVVQKFCGCCNLTVANKKSRQPENEIMEET